MPDFVSLDREALEAVRVSGRDLGRLVKAQYDGFREAGFNRSEALTLTSEWMKVVLVNGGDEE